VVHHDAAREKTQIGIEFRQGLAFDMSLEQSLGGDTDGERADERRGNRDNRETQAERPHHAPSAST